MIINDAMLDGFSRCNQIHVNEEDQLKIAFTTPWGTFASFGLVNAGANF